MGRAATPLTTRELAGQSLPNYTPGALTPATAPMPAQREAFSGDPSGGLSGSGLGVGLGGPPAGAGVGGTSPVIDGKQFFRAARSRLSYEAFNLFLASIKRLNSQAQTREETLDEARRIFGTEQQDLYKD